MSTGGADEPGDKKRTQMAPLIPPPPSLGKAGAAPPAFPFPTPSSGVRSDAPSFSAPRVEPARGKTVLAAVVPRRVPRPGGGDDDPTLVRPPEVRTATAAPLQPEAQRFDPAQMRDDDLDWAPTAPPPVAPAPPAPPPSVDEGAATGRFGSVPADDETTQVRSPRPTAERPAPAVVSDDETTQVRPPAARRTEVAAVPPVRPPEPRAAPAMAPLPIPPPATTATATSEPPAPAAAPAPAGSNVPVILAAAAATVAAAGLAWFVLGSDAPEERTTAAPVPQRVAAETRAPAPAEPAPKKEVAPPVAEPPPEPVPEPVAEPVPEPPPEPVPEPPPVEEGGDGAALPENPALAPARAALEDGDHARAYELAAAVQAATPGNDALAIMTLAACKTGQAPDARSAYRALVGRTVRRRVTDACVADGIRIQWDGDGWTSTELLDRAEQALGQGKFAEAYDLAQQSHRKKRRSTAVAVMARAACGNQDGAEAGRLYTLVSAGERGAIEEACSRAGVTLPAATAGSEP